MRIFKFKGSWARIRAGNRAKFRILVALSLALGVMLAIFALAIWRLQQKHLATAAELSAEEVAQWLHAEEEWKAALLRTTLEAIMNDGQLAEAFRQRDSAALLKRATPLFDLLRREHGITHFYFHQPDRTVWLRVHAPGITGDKIDRHTLLMAERTGNVSVAIERGLTGILTLRAVSPWRQEGQLLGYLELGVEFTKMVQEVRQQLNNDVEFLIAVDKRFLDRQQWTEAMNGAGRPDEWNRFPRMVVVNRTVGALPKLAADYLSAENLQRTDSLREDNLQLAFLPLTDVTGKDLGKLIVLQDVAKELAESSSSIRLVVVVSLAAGVAAIVFFYFFLTRTENDLSERTARLENEIAERKKLDVQLAETHLQLMESARQAGMTEVATGVLHNVGNVLNSVNVSATLVADQMRHTQAGNVAKLAGLLDQHKADLAGFLTQDPRGQMIPAYLVTLAESLAAEQKTLLTELDHLRKNIEHIKDIVATQQSHAKTSGVIARVPLAELVEDALRMNASSLARHEVELVRDFQVRPVLNTDQHKIMQILINLVRNAKLACAEAGRPDKRITVRIAGEAPWVRISVSDNGVGIPAENLARIFNHGFTTRKTGHGFGLHSAALAARELGGSLAVQSDGPDRGATFILELPLHADPPAP